MFFVHLAQQIVSDFILVYVKIYQQICELFNIYTPNKMIEGKIMAGALKVSK